MFRLTFLLTLVGICYAVVPLSEESRQIAIDMHNEFRSLVARGGTRSRGIVPLPSAAKMRKVSYSMELEKIASGMASVCDISRHTDAHDYIENYAVYSVKIASISQEKAMTEGIQKWFGEIFNVGLNGVIFTRSTSVGVRHFTQMIWENVEDIGCSVNFCGDIRGSSMNGRFRTRALVVCVYHPRGNKYEHPIYETGTACSKCSEIPNGKCDDETQLCVVQ